MGITKDIYRDAAKGDAMDLATAFLLTVIALLALYGVFYLADSSFLDAHEERGVVKSLDHKPSWVQTTTTMSGTTPITTVIVHPESWSVVVSINYGATVSCGISKRQYSELGDGDNISIMTVKGRMSGSTYCKSVKE